MAETSATKCPRSSAWTQFLSKPAARFPRHSHPNGSEIFKQGNPADAVYIIHEGLVKLVRICADGRQMIVGLRVPGDLLGAEAALLDDEYSVAAITLTTTEMTYVPAYKFRQLVRRNSRFSWLVHQLSNKIVKQELSNLATLGCLKARERVEEVLRVLDAYLSSSEGSGRKFLPMRDWELAQIVAITPQHLCRVLHTLEADGVVQRHGRRWILNRIPGASPVQAG
jgi:CRP-like cAMP-binding protein